MGRGGEWLLVYCGPRVKLVEDQVNDTVHIVDLPPDLVAAADSLLNAAALLPVLAAPESNGSAASEILLRLDQANDHIFWRGRSRFVVRMPEMRIAVPYIRQEMLHKCHRD